MTTQPTQTIKVSSTNATLIADLHKHIIKALQAMEHTSNDAHYRRACALAITQTRVVTASK